MKKKEIVEELRRIKGKLKAEVDANAFICAIAKDYISYCRDELEKKGEGDAEISRLADEAEAEADRNEAVVNALRKVIRLIDERILDKCGKEGK